MSAESQAEISTTRITTSWQSGFHKVEVPIEQIPDQFRTAYKFKLIPDSAWY